MPTFQVTCRELVYVDRTYEIEAETAEEAARAIRQSTGGAGVFVDEQIQDTHSFCKITAVHDDNGSPVKW